MLLGSRKKKLVYLFMDMPSEHKRAQGRVRDAPLEDSGRFAACNRPATLLRLKRTDRGSVGSGGGGDQSGKHGDHREQCGGGRRHVR